MSGIITGGIVIGMSLLVKVIDHFYVTTEDTMKSLEESITAFNETTEEIKNLNKELEVTENRIKELQKLSDAGTISIADKAELDTLKEQNKELARQIALKQRQQITEGKEVLEKAQNLSSKTVNSKYDFNSTDRYESTVGKAVNIEDELRLAINAYEETEKEIDKWEAELTKNNLSDEERRVAQNTLTKLEDQLSTAEARADEMYAILEAERQAYLNLDEAGYTLSFADKERLNDLNGFNDTFLLWNHNLNQTKESFASLNAEQQRSILLNNLLKQGLSDTEAQSVVNNISDSDLVEYWDKDFSFVQPQMTDYSTAEEYGKAYAEAWLSGARKTIQKPQNYAIDVLSITQTVDKIDSELKPVFDNLKSAYQDVFSLNDDGERIFDISGVDIDTLSSIKSAIDSMNEIGGINIATETFEEFAKVLTNTRSTAEDVQEQFDNLVTEILNQSDIVSNGLNTDVLRQTLEKLGVVNVEEVLADLINAERELIEYGIELETVTNEQAIAFLNSGEASDIAKQYLEAYIIKKQLSNEETLNTKADIESLEKLCESLGTTGEMYQKLAHLKYLFNTIESNNYLPTSELAKINQQIANTQSEIYAIANEEYTVDFNFDTAEYSFDGLKDEADGFGKSANSSAKDTAETFDWIEKLISRIQRTITNLGKTVSATYKQWSTRNNALAQEMQAVNQEISIQQKAYEAYMTKANSISLPESYKELVRNGGLRIEDISDEGLRNQISAFQEWYEKALDCYDAIEDLRASLAELAMTKFNNISAQFDNQMSMSNHNISMLEGYISQAEAAGMIVSEEYYRAMIEQQESNVSQLKDKYSSLLSAFDEAVQNGSIEKYSEDWYEMLQSINDVELEIQSATTELIEFNQALQQLNWATFDRMQGYISNITSEAEFLIDMLDEKDLFDDNGNMTDRGLAVQGLHAVNYNVYMAQAQDYADEIAKLNEEIAKDPYDMELIDRRNELIQAQQDAISNAMKEKEAILALIEEGYNKMLESLQELIDKRKEALQAEKDLYDYQNTISEKTDNIAKLRKQLQAYAGDNSESAKSKIQEIQAKLEEAEKDLQETEYEKYLSDQEKMLDDLYRQTEDWVNERLDNIDVLLEEAINATNQNAETISNAIRDISDEYGYTLTEEMESIWDYESAALNGITDIVSLVGDKLTTVNFALDSIGTNMQNMINSINNFATQNANSIAALQQAIISSQPSSGGSTPAPTPPSNPSNPTNPTTPPNDDGNTGDKEYAIVDRTMKLAIVQNLSKEEAREMIKRYPNGTVVDMDNIDPKTGRWNGQGGDVKLYATGTKNAKRGLAIVSESEYGDEIILDNHGNAILARGTQLYPFEGGETVINANDTSKILNNVFSPLKEQEFLGNMIKKPNYSSSYGMHKSNNNITNDISMNITLPNVTDYNSFVTQLQSDKRFEKIIQSMTSDRMLGKNSLNKYKF